MSEPTRAFRNRRQAGIALVFTLWGLALLALMAAAFLNATRTETQAIRNISASAEAEAMADGAVHWAIWRLIAGQRRVASQTGEGQLRRDGVPFSLPTEGGTVYLEVQDEAGKVDLNGTDLARLERLLLAVGSTPGEARLLAGRIVDFRDKDSLAQGGGNETTAYVDLPAGPANRPFRAIEEIGEVAGIGKALAARLRPHVTVGPFARSIDPQFATRAALLAQPGVTAADAAAFLAARSGDQGAEPPQGPPYARSPANRFTITARAHSDNGAVFVREALVLLDKLTTPPFQISSWRQVDDFVETVGRP